MIGRTIHTKESTDGKAQAKRTFTQREVVDLIHELRVKQQELENQNTKLRETQQALKLSHEKFMELYDFAPIGYISVKESGFVVQGNLTAAILLGIERDAFAGVRLSDFVAEEDKSAFRQFTRKIRKTESFERCELLFVRRDGISFYAQLESGPIRQQETCGREYRMLFSDITDRKRMEDALLKEKERVQVTLESLGEAVITTDENAIIDYLNPIAETLTEWSRDAAIGQPLERVFQIIEDQTHIKMRVPLSKCLVEKQVISLVENCVLKAPSGREYGIQYSAAPIRKYDGRALGIVLVFSNISEVRNLTRQIAYQATHDSLTGLVNRREFETRLQRALKRSKESKTTHALCYMDLDHFKVVNDTAGHGAGDDLLKKLTNLLSLKIRSRDTLARFGGDEFSLLLDNCPLEQAQRVAESLVAAVSNFSFEWQGKKFNVGISIGVVAVTSHVNTTAELMSCADVACYTAKRLGRNRVHVYRGESEITYNHHREIQRVAEISESLRNNRFQLYGQKILPLGEQSDSGDVTYELLLRSTNEAGEIELPGRFLPAAERYSMMASIDRWVIRTALSSYAQYFGSGRGACIAINLSGNSLTDDGVLKFIQEQLRESGVAPDRICFEITEMTAISNLAYAKQFILNLKQLGCFFALDDFGSGLSSFTYLKNLPVDYLKIDGSFVQDMVKNKIDHAMVAAINQVGHTMGIKTIAECVESQAIVDQLRELKVDYVQGYAIARPMPLDQLT